MILGRNISFFVFMCVRTEIVFTYMCFCVYASELHGTWLLVGLIVYALHGNCWIDNLACSYRFASRAKKEGVIVFFVEKKLVAMGLVEL